MVPESALRFPPAVLRAAGIALLLAAAVVVAAGAPAAWFLLAVCGVAVLVVLVPAVLEDRIVDPLAIIYGFAAIYFVVRPFQLFLAHTDLASFSPPSPDPLKSALQLDGSEVARFVTFKLQGDLQSALSRAIGACALFLVVVLVGYRLAQGRRLAARFERFGRGTDGIDVKRVVAVCVALGLIAQLAIVIKTGGLSATFNTSLKQSALKAGFVLYLLAGFSAAGVLIWAAWARPATRRAWWVFAAVTFEQCLFFALIGSRTRALIVLLALAIVFHYIWRPLKMRWIISAVVAAAVLSAAILGVRNATYTRHFPHTLTQAPKYILDPRGLLNNSTQFDQLFVATSTIGHTLPYKGGGWIVSAVRSYVPHFIDHNKPEPGDIQFRKSVWGRELGAGRPISIIGDFLYDFGWAGIVIGSLLLGLLIRGLGGLVASRGEGRPYRVTLYALATVVLYELVFTTYSVGLNFALTLGVPFLVAVFAIGRVWPGSLSRPRWSRPRAVAGS